MIPTRTGLVLNAVSQGKTVFCVSLDALEESFPPVFFTLPSLREAMAVKTMVKITPQYESDTVTEFIQRYCLNPDHAKWLISQAPAGLAPGLMRCLISFSTVKDSEGLRELMAANRATADIFEQFKTILAAEASTSFEKSESMDILQLVRAVTNVESYLLRKGVYEEEIKIYSNEEVAGFVEKQQKKIQRKRIKGEGRIGRKYQTKEAIESLQETESDSPGKEVTPSPEDLVKDLYLKKHREEQPSTPSTPPPQQPGKGVIKGLRLADMNAQNNYLGDDPLITEFKNPFEMTLEDEITGYKNQKGLVALRGAKTEKPILRPGDVLKQVPKRRGF